MPVSGSVMSPASITYPCCWVGKDGLEYTAMPLPEQRCVLDLEHVLKSRLIKPSEAGRHNIRVAAEPHPVKRRVLEPAEWTFD